MNCPLCHSASHQVVETISLDILVARYAQKYQAKIRHLFTKPDLHLLECTDCNLRYYSQLAAGDEAFYNALQIQPWYYVDEKPEFHRAAALIPKGARVLETGSGKGNFARFLQNPQYTGLDFSQKAVEMAAAKGTTIVRESVQEHARKHAGEYDVACSFQVLEHVSEIHSFIQAQVDCLKPGGTLIIGVPAEDSYIASAFDLILNMPPHHLSRWSDRCLGECARIFNLKLVGIWHDELQPHHYFDYAYTLSLHAIRKQLGIPYKALENGFSSKWLKAPAYVLGKILQHGLHPGNLPSGHTVVAAFQKPE